MKPVRSRERGFTLLEVIIAFAALALALTLLLGTLSGSARQIRWSADAGRAALHAQSLLAQLEVDPTLAPGHRRGQYENGRYRWTLDVSPYRDPSVRTAQPVQPGAARLLQLAVDIRWGDDSARNALQVRTLRLRAPVLDQAPPATQVGQ